MLEHGYEPKKWLNRHDIWIKRDEISRPKGMIF